MGDEMADRHTKTVSIPVETAALLTSTIADIPEGDFPDIREALNAVILGLQACNGAVSRDGADEARLTLRITKA